jgi:hypothetical protein
MYTMESDREGKPHMSQLLQCKCAYVLGPYAPRKKGDAGIRQT